jgi:N-dimethylarginine dimethylaminohydrolase
MCPPDHFEVAYSINPWMDPADPPDPDVAREQWDGLVSLLEAAGAQVDLLPPVEGLPDLVFTSDLGVVEGSRFVPARPRHPERHREVEQATAWFAGQGFEVVPLSDDGDASLEGGEVARVADGFLVSHGFRTNREGVRALGEALGLPVQAVELTDERLYHLDAVLCPMDEERAVLAPHGVADPEAVAGRFGEVLALDEDEALTFCANAVVVGERVVMPACPPRVGRWIEDRGFEVAVTPAGEFLKAGGSVHCLTLRVA